MGINGDAILMMFVRVGQVFFFGGEEGNADFNHNTGVSLMAPITTTTTTGVETQFQFQFQFQFQSHNLSHKQ